MADTTIKQFHNSIILGDGGGAATVKQFHNSIIFGVGGSNTTISQFRNTLLILSDDSSQALSPQAICFFNCI